MFDTRSEAWERAGLEPPGGDEAATRHARQQAAALALLLIGVLVAYHYRVHILGSRRAQQWHSWIQWGTVIVLLAIGWMLARAISRGVVPSAMRRLDPATAGTVGFIIRLLTLVFIVLIALDIAGASANALIAGSAFTAIVLGLAAQQTLGNLFAGVVLLTAHPFRVGQLVRLQAGALGGVLEGVVSSLGLMYTTLARGEDRIMIPNTGVLSAVVVPIREPSRVDVRVRLSSGVRPSHVQALLDGHLTTPTRSPATVLLEQIDGDQVVVRVQATPRRAEDGAKLADEIIETLAEVTGEHEVVNS